MVVVISARNLIKRYDSFTAVDGISFDVEAGRCFGFLGPNGAGKTTAMKMINCISPVTEGELRVLGMDVRENPREIKAQIGVAPQDNNLDPDFTVVQNLMVYARYFDIGKNVASERAEELLHFMQLVEKRDVKITELSGGMKRRLIIARALMNEPHILILDEPTTGLDPQARHLIWEKVRELKRKGVTVLLTTHYMDEAEELCDRLVIMEKGRILVEDQPRKLIDDVVGTGVISIYQPDDTVIALAESRGWSYERTIDAIFIYTDDTAEALTVIKERTSANNATVRNATLEDVFLRLTGRGLRD
jgi:lipooligosaccharide transport system ATP-binding protein